jgi:hypothetical protein
MLFCSVLPFILALIAEYFSTVVCGYFCGDVKKCLNMLIIREKMRNFAFELNEC